ncbi:MAG: CPBP family intramembrane metalloprotease [Clostridiales bacterium]|nr:CPBP family intramembrane metalloprotease [Clostridiales bacterium]
MAKELSNQAKWRPWKGVVLFVIALAWLIAGSLTAFFIGTVSTLLVQLGFLAIAIIACLINKTPLKEVFPIKKITVRDFFGTVLMWMGSLPLGLCSALAVGKLLPQTFENVTTGVNQIATGVLVLGFIMTVICPPICEEAIMRGAVLSNFRGIKKDWVIVLIVGVMFGILHTDPVRFLNTALLGGCMAYLMVKRNNFILPVMFHFINNFTTIGISTLSSMFTSQAAQQAESAVSTSEVVAASLDALPSFMILACLCPMILTIGAHLIKRQKEISDGTEPKGMKLGAKIGLSAIPCVLLLAGGIILTAMSING